MATPSNQTIAIIDTGSGNIRSALKAFQHVAHNEARECRPVLTADPDIVRTAERIVLPGQGAFGDVMAGLNREEGLRKALEEAVLEKGRPYLGICVGMQMLVDKGYEHGEHAGLGWISGDCRRFDIGDPELKIPHMGWNELIFEGPGEQDNRHFVLRSISHSKHYYFVHSYVVHCKDKTHVLARCAYGKEFAAVIGRDNIVGVQFHPEKSQETGLRLISDFMHWKP